ncbi:hypothetical protein, partial [Paraburkholderia sp.]|uniref:hypothetical protein n=1 Tax=Paraburkholderia sp. TaxID=1926495 RepID=UPI00286FAD27
AAAARAASIAMVAVSCGSRAPVEMILKSILHRDGRRRHQVLPAAQAVRPGRNAARRHARRHDFALPFRKRQVVCSRLADRLAATGASVRSGALRLVFPLVICALRVASPAYSRASFGAFPTPHCDIASRSLKRLMDFNDVS